MEMTEEMRARAAANVVEAKRLAALAHPEHHQLAAETRDAMLQARVPAMCAWYDRMFAEGKFK